MLAAAMDQAPKYRAHIVLVPMFLPSHSLPMFDFAFRLASRSIKVTILSSAHHVRQVWTHPLYWRATPRLLAAGDSIELVPVEDGIDDGTLQGFRKTILAVASWKIFVSAFGKHLGLLMARVPKPCCVVSDMLVGWTQELAKEFGIPRFVLHIQPASNLSLMLHGLVTLCTSFSRLEGRKPLAMQQFEEAYNGFNEVTELTILSGERSSVPNLVAEGRLPLTEENRTEPIPIPGFKFPLHPCDLVTELKDEEYIKRGAYDHFLRMSKRAYEAPIVLVNTFRELEEDCFAAFDNLISQASSDHQCSVLFIAFGTLVENEMERIQEIAFALESSKQTFLWSAGSLNMRPNQPPPPHFSKLLPPGFEERTRKQGKVVTMVVPQIHILRHPACGAFMSHCGWNSALESITSAVPIIAWPQQFEQWMTARYLIDTLEVAAELQEEKERRGFVRREEIQRVVHLVMHQAEGVVFRTRMAELKQAASKYAYSNTHLDSFLDGLRA